jgi:hypothetical protein
MADDKHRKDQKLHNSAREGSAADEAHDKRISYKNNKDRNGHPVQPENESASLVDLAPTDLQAFFDDYVAESEARWARLAPRAEEERVEDPVSKYNEAIADHLKEIAKKAMKQEPIAVTPQPITLIPAPTPSSSQTQSGTVTIYGDGLGKPSNTPELSFERSELDQYVAYRSEGLAKKSLDWINRASQALWESTKGEISHQTMTDLRTFILSKYSSVDAHRKVLGFAAAFLKYLAQVRIEPRYLSFTLFLERPKTTRVKKAITERIVTREDINVLFKRIATAEEDGKEPL